MFSRNVIGFLSFIVIKEWSDEKEITSWIAVVEPAFLQESSKQMLVQ